MIKLFRKIRQGLLSENKTGKYLKYAIGEILLVIIGILIALQVNNFNEHRKEIKLSHSILLEIHENLHSDKERLYSNLEFIKDITGTYNYLENNYHTLSADSLSVLLSKMHFLSNWNANITGFSRFKDKPVEGVISDQLRQAITHYYTYVLTDTNNHSAKDLTLTSLNRIRDYFVEYGFPITDSKNWIQKPKDISTIPDLVANPKFIGLLRSHHYNWIIQERGYSTVLEKIDHLLQDLENYFKDHEIVYNNK